MDLGGQCALLVPDEHPFRVQLYDFHVLANDSYTNSPPTRDIPKRVIMVKFRYGIDLITTAASTYVVSLPCSQKKARDKLKNAWVVGWLSNRQRRETIGPAAEGGRASSNWCDS